MCPECDVPWKVPVDSINVEFLLSDNLDNLTYAMDASIGPSCELNCLSSMSVPAPFAHGLNQFTLYGVKSKLILRSMISPPKITQTGNIGGQTPNLSIMTAIGQTGF